MKSLLSVLRVTKAPSDACSSVNMAKLFLPATTAQEISCAKVKSLLSIVKCSFHSSCKVGTLQFSMY